MAAAEGSEDDAGVDGLTQRFASGDFVELRIAPTVDALVAAAILANALERHGTPFRTRATDARPRDDEEIAVGFGGNSPVPAGNATRTAIDLAEALGTDTDPTEMASAELLGRRPVTAERVPGLGLVTDDRVDGLAHSTLVHGPFSADLKAAERMLDRVADERDAAIPSVMALTLLEDPDGQPSAAVGRMLGKVQTPDGALATANGLSDVLDVLSDIDPGLGLALAHGHDAAVSDALDTWRQTATEVHAACREIPPEVDGPIAEVRTDVDAPAVLARLVRDFRTTAPVVLVRGSNGGAVAAQDVPGPRLASALPDPAVPRLDGRATFSDSSDEAEVRAALREVA